MLKYQFYLVRLATEKMQRKSLLKKWWMRRIEQATMF